jgi:hypothetical protein
MHTAFYILNSGKIGLEKVKKDINKGTVVALSKCKLRQHLNFRLAEDAGP